MLRFNIIYVIERGEAGCMSSLGHKGALKYKIRLLSLSFPETWSPENFLFEMGDQTEFARRLGSTTNEALVILTHWGRATHICVGNLTIIVSDNGLSPGRRQAII